MKVAIIGFSGAGKSTLAKKLSEIYQEEVLYLDTVFWLPNWVERPREETLKIVGDFLDTHNGWVIDGSYGAFHQERRLEEADEIIILSLNQHHNPFYRNRHAGPERSEIYPGNITLLL